MKPKLTLIILTGVLMLSFVNVKAQADSSSFTSTHLKAAEDFLIATGINTKFGAITDNIIGTFSKQIPEKDRPAFVDVMKKFMQKYYTWETLKGDLSKMYAQEFTEDELKQLTAFYNTPLGQKFGEKVVVLQQKGMMMGQQIVMNHRGELEQMMKAAMPADKN